MQRLRGRNLTHIGCTLGLTLGLTVGLLGAIAVLQVWASVGAAVAIFAGVTLGIGVLGFVLGGLATNRLWGSGRTRQ
jgi:hypothetical protein